MRAIAPKSPLCKRDELTLAAGVAMAAAHAQFQSLQLSFPTGNAGERVRLRNAFVLTLLAANTEAVVCESVVQLFDGRACTRICRRLTQASIQQSSGTPTG